jgi:hypothetical protein
MMDSSAQRVLLGGVVAGVLGLLGLVYHALFIQFPMVMTTGDAHLQRWIGPDAARLAFLTLAIIVCGGYI